MKQMTSFKPRWWEWPSIVSIEAPGIALLWQALSARALRVHLEMHHRVLLGAAVWLAYAADRWADAQRGASVTARHRFVRRRIRTIAGVWVVAVVAAAVYGAMHLSVSEWGLCGIGLASAAFLVVGVRRLRTGGGGERLWRGMTATVFLLGVLLFVVPRYEKSPHTALVWAVGLWTVFFGNLAVIARAESRSEAEPSRKDSGGAPGVFGARNPRVSKLAALGTAAAVAIVYWIVSVALLDFAWAVAVSLFALAVVDAAGQSDPEVSHAWADLVLVVAPVAALIAGS